MINTPPVQYRGLDRMPFWPPGPEIGWTPFTDNIYLPVDPETSIETYVSRYDDLLDSWIDSFGIVDSYQLENEHGWNITRLTLVQGPVYAKPPGPGLPENNISVGAIYLMETDERPYEFVWWEMVPFTWAIGWEHNYTFWFNNLDVPPALEKKLLEDEALSAIGGLGYAISLDPSPVHGVCWGSAEYNPARDLIDPTNGTYYGRLVDENRLVLRLVGQNDTVLVSQRAALRAYVKLTCPVLRLQHCQLDTRQVWRVFLD